MKVRIPSLDSSSKEFVDLLLLHTQPPKVLQNFHSVVLTSPWVQQLVFQTCRSLMLYLSECSSLSRIQAASALWTLSFDGCKILFSVCLVFLFLFIFGKDRRRTFFKLFTYWSWNKKYLRFIFRLKLSFFFMNSSWFIYVTEEPNSVFMNNDWSSTNSHGASYRWCHAIVR